MINSSSPRGLDNERTVQNPDIYVAAPLNQDDTRACIGRLATSMAKASPDERSDINFKQEGHVTIYKSKKEPNVVLGRLEPNKDGSLFVEEILEGIKGIYKKSQEERTIDPKIKLGDLRIFGSEKTSFIVGVVERDKSSKKKISLHDFVSNFRKNMSPTGMYQGEGGVLHVTHAKVSNGDPGRLRSILARIFLPATTVRLEIETPIIEIYERDQN